MGGGEAARGASFAGAATSIAAFVGYTAEGPENRAVRLASFADFESELGGLAAASELSYAVRDFFANGGTDAYAVRVTGEGGGLPGPEELVGGETGGTGIHALGEVDLWNLLCIPDATRPSPGDPRAPDLDQAGFCHVVAKALELCVERRAFLLVDPRPGMDSPDQALTFRSTVLAPLSSPNAALYFPRVQAPDPLAGGRLRASAPCGAIAGIYARTDAAGGVWTAPAGIAADLRGLAGPVRNLHRDEADLLSRAGVNPLRTFADAGTVVWGARTLVDSEAEGSDWLYVPVRRLALFIEESVRRGIAWAAGAPRDVELTARLRFEVELFLDGLFRRGAFAGPTPREAYWVHCDSTPASPSDLDAGTLYVQIGFAPLVPAEFVILTIQQLAGQNPDPDPDPDD